MKKGVVRKVIQSNLQSMDAKDRRWLTGFIEAEGSFTESKRGDLQFVITQGYRNLAVLHHIKKIIGFGSINKQGPRTFRYVVQDQIGLAEIISYLNGNLVLKKRIAGLAKFIEAYNARYTTSIEAITTGVEPTREDGWISGFMDGDGCFTIGYIESKKTFNIRAILSQKDDIEHIRQVTGGSMEHHSVKQVNSIVMKDLPKSEGKNTEWIIAYLEEHPLRTTKWNSFLIWQYIRQVLLTRELTPQDIENLKKMVQWINQDPMELEDIYIPGGK